ncbi:MAG: hypothetical protein AVDCRST_MAG53-1010, partial [uncultured Solirubrobacteraceae bacterium]
CLSASSNPKTQSGSSPNPWAARRAANSSASSCAPGSTRSLNMSSAPTTPRRSPTSTSTTSRCWRHGTPRWRSATPSPTATSSSTSFRRSARTSGRHSRSPRASAARRPSTPGSPRSRHSRPSFPGSPANGHASSRRSASSSTCGTAWAATT